MMHLYGKAFAKDGKQLRKVMAAAEKALAGKSCGKKLRKNNYCRQLPAGSNLFSHYDLGVVSRDLVNIVGHIVDTHGRKALCDSIFDFYEHFPYLLNQAA